MPEPVLPGTNVVSDAKEAQTAEALTHVQSTRPTVSKLQKLFVGEDGLRAGWSFLLFLLFTSLLGACLNFTLHAMVHRPKGSGPPTWIMLSGSALTFCVVLLAAWLVSRMEQRALSSYFLTSLRGRGFDLVLGIVTGFLLLSALVGALIAGGWMTYNGFLLTSPGQAVLWAFLYALSFMGVGLFEEFAFRGFTQFTLTRGFAGILRAAGFEDQRETLSFWLAAATLGFLFGFVHRGNPGEGILGLVAAGLIGVVFAFSVWRTGSLWWAIGFHAAWDWGESFFYGTADSGGLSPHRLLSTFPRGNPFFSGGTVGPEGSVFVFVAIALLAMIIAITLKPRPFSPSMKLEQPHEEFGTEYASS